jgi:predicted metalloprotease with PDZ domain
MRLTSLSLRGRAARLARSIAAGVALLVAISPTAAASEPLRYRVDLADTVGHRFRVRLAVSGLTERNGTFQFAATAPGTYQTMNIGRFVRSFSAFDGQGRAIPAGRVSVNQWKITTPERVREIRYSVLATWDTTVTEQPIYLMCGSALRADHALINGQAVFGFPEGMQSSPISVALSYPRAWTIGTSLRFADGEYHAATFDELVDSPILLGRLTRADLRVTGVPVRIFAYSKTNKISATQVRDAMRQMLLAAGGFLGKLPVDRYTFLFHFGDDNAGAWEHSYGSEYVLAEAPFTGAFGAGVTDIASHEFFHVVTPLNIHSEIIEKFNFASPVPSDYLWLYEGTTEWAAHKMQLEAGLKTPATYLSEIAAKVRRDRISYDTTYSLVKLARVSFSDSGQKQYGNIYQRGAVVSGLLDIKLLELSGGRRGLRDLISDLAKTYGKQHAFPERTFVDSIVARTSPEVRDFFARYIEGAERPPVKEYYAKLGIRLVEDSLGLPVRFEIDSAATPQQLRLREAWLTGNRKVVPIS